MRITAFAGFFAFLVFINAAPVVHAQDLDVSNIDQSTMVVAFNDNATATQPSLAKPKAKKHVTIYTVKDGDSLTEIAKKYKTSWQRIYDKNKKISEPNIIQPGDKIIIPGKK